MSTENCSKFSTNWEKFNLFQKQSVLSKKTDESRGLAISKDFNTFIQREKSDNSKAIFITEISQKKN